MVLRFSFQICHKLAVDLEHVTRRVSAFLRLFEEVTELNQILSESYFVEHLLCTTVLNAEDTAVNKSDRILAFFGVYISVGECRVNQINRR